MMKCDVNNRTLWHLGLVGHSGTGSKHSLAIFPLQGGRAKEKNGSFSLLPALGKGVLAAGNVLQG
jgi:hypothetical protein